MRRALAVAAVWVLDGCGASPYVVEPYIEIFPAPPMLHDGRIEQHLQAHVPDGIDGSSCRLVLRWAGPSTQGEVGPLPPTAPSARDPYWRVEVEVGAIDVVQVRGGLTCGALARDVGPRWAGTSAGAARYCRICASTPPRPAGPPYDRGNPGLEVFARVGSSIEARGSAIVDRCTDRTLVELGDVGARVRGETDRESELALVFAADHGEDVCTGAEVPGAIEIELDESAVDGVAARLREIPGIGARLSLPPMPG